MGLTKAKAIKGYSYEYWKITELRQNYRTGQTRIRLDLYKDKATREADVLDFVEGQSHFVTTSTLEHRDEAYTEVVKSNLSDETDVAAGNAEKVGDEMNWFADAEEA